MATNNNATSLSKLSLNEELWRLGSKMSTGLTNKGSDLISFIEKPVPSWCEVESYQLLHFDKETRRFLPPDKVQVKHFSVDSDWYGWHSTMRSSPKDHYFDCLLLSRVWNQAAVDEERWPDEDGVRWHIKSFPRFGFGTEPTVIRIVFRSGARGWIEVNCSNTLPLYLDSGVSGRDRSIGLEHLCPQQQAEIEYEF